MEVSDARSLQPPPPPSDTGFVIAKSWQHFVGGGLGGMCGAIVTSPFDVVKTRLQSDLFHEKHASVGVVGSNGSVMVIPRRMGWLGHFIETGHILRDIYRYESPRALFKGLGPMLVGVVPARSIFFFTYGNGKKLIADKFNHGRENALVYVAAASIGGVVTGTATNPIWVVKTRMQLSASERAKQPLPSHGNARVLGGSWETIKQIMRAEGVRGFYKGLSASYLGVTETTIQWVLYEHLKHISTASQDRGGAMEWLGILGSSGMSKFIAGLITYPHEVLRTRLRQPSVNGKLKYTGLVQTLRLVLAEEGARSLYGGLSAHLMRSVPNSVVMFPIYEGLLRWADSS